MEQRLQELGIAPLEPDQEPVTSQYIKRLEESIGAELPPEYRSFVKAHGTCTSAHELIYRVSGDWLGGTDIFFGADPSGAYDLFEHWDAFRGRLPPSLLPIGTDPGGDLLCIGFAGPLRGKIFFWDEENEGPPGQPWWDNIYEVADSLPNFFDKLQIEPDE